MEPITTVIAAAAGVGLSKITEAGIIDVYNGVKNAIAKRFGAESKLKKAVDELEANPASAARKAVLDEEVVNVKANEDIEILQAVKWLLVALEKLERQQPGATSVKFDGVNVKQDFTADEIVARGAGSTGLEFTNGEIQGSVHLGKVGATAVPK